MIALTAAPWIFPQGFVSILVNFFVLLIMATMWNLLAGYAGMVSIGQQAFVGLGGYGVLYFAIKGVSPFFGGAPSRDRRRGHRPADHLSSSSGYEGDTSP